MQAHPLETQHLHQNKPQAAGRVTHAHESSIQGTEAGANPELKVKQYKIQGLHTQA